VIFTGKMGPSTTQHWSWKNGCTNRAVICDNKWGGPKALCIRWAGTLALAPPGQYGWTTVCGSYDCVCHQGWQHGLFQKYSGSLVMYICIYLLIYYAEHFIIHLKQHSINDKLLTKQKYDTTQQKSRQNYA